MGTKSKPQQERIKQILETRLNRSQLIKLNQHIRQQANLINIQNEYDRLKGDISKYNHGLQPYILTNRILKLKDMAHRMGLKLDDKEYIN